jgi:hypothetical protein
MEPDCRKINSTQFQNVIDHSKKFITKCQILIRLNALFAAVIIYCGFRRAPLRVSTDFA